MEIKSMKYKFCTALLCLIGASLLLFLLEHSSPEPPKNPKIDPRAKTQSFPVNPPGNRKEKKSFGLGFIPNEGQWNFPALYWSRKGNIDCFVMKNGFILDLKNSSNPSLIKTDHRKSFLLGNFNRRRKQVFERQKGTILKFEFQDADPNCKISPRKPLRGYFNFFLGSNPNRWKSRIHSYEKVHFDNLYPGIDMDLKWGERGITYDFLLKPGSELGQIRVKVEGAKGVGLTRNGRLTIKTDFGIINQPPPSTFTMGMDGKRQKCPCSIISLGSNIFSFSSKAWNKNTILFLDPDLYYSTYIGGVFTDLITEAIPLGKNRYIACGLTLSPNFPTTPGAYSRLLNLNGQTPPYNIYDVALFEMDFSAVGSNALIWATFFGGSNEEDLGESSLSTDSKGNPVFCGSTASKDLPTTPLAWDRTFGTKNGQMYTDIFIAKISKDGSKLLSSTFLGGSEGEYYPTMSLLQNDMVVISCDTYSIFDYPVTKGAIWKKGFGPTLTVLDPTFSRLIFSSYWEPSSTIGAMTANQKGEIYLSGQAGKNYPTTPGAIRNTPMGPGDVYVSKFSFTKKKFLWSTFLGLRSGDQVLDMDLGPGEDVFLLGRAIMDMIANPRVPFPTTHGAWDSGIVDWGGDGFIVRINAQGSKILFSTLLGFDPKLYSTENLEVNSLGQAVVCGSFPSYPGDKHPTPDSIINERKKPFPRFDLCYVLRLGSKGCRMLYFSFFGGYTIPPSNLWNNFYGISILTDYTSIFCGRTVQSDFPTTPNSYSPYPPSAGQGDADGVIVEMGLKPNGVKRYGTWSWSPLGAPTCYVTADPKEGENFFGFACWKAPQNSSGALLIGRKPLAQGIQVLGITLWVDPASSFFALPVTSDKDGRARIQLPLPKGTKGARFAAQFVWKNGGSSQFSASDALEVTVQ